MRSAGDKILIVLLIVLILIVGGVLVFMMPGQDTTQSAPETTVSGPVVIDTEPDMAEKYVEFLSAYNSKFSPGEVLNNPKYFELLFHILKHTTR